jgi:hypothetical protein
MTVLHHTFLIGVLTLAAVYLLGLGALAGALLAAFRRR